jgi:hypothetical protein
VRDGLGLHLEFKLFEHLQRNNSDADAAKVKLATRSLASAGEGLEFGVWGLGFRV